MYKVFIVEDEHLIRDSLRKQLLSLAETHPLIFSGKPPTGKWPWPRSWTSNPISC